MASACGGERIGRLFNQNTQPTLPSEMTMPASSPFNLKPICHLANLSNLDAARTGSRITSRARRRHERKTCGGGQSSQCRCSHFFQAERPTGRPQMKMLGGLWNPFKATGPRELTINSRLAPNSSVSSTRSHKKSFSPGTVTSSPGQRSGRRECNRAAETRALETDDQVSEQDTNANSSPDGETNGRSVFATNGLHYEQKDSELGARRNLEDIESLHSRQDEEVFEEFSNAEGAVSGGISIDDLDVAVPDSREPGVTNLLRKDLEIEDVQVFLPAVKDNERVIVTAAQEQNAVNIFMGANATADAEKNRVSPMSKVYAGVVDACEPLITWVEQTGHRTGAGKIMARDLEVLTAFGIEAKKALRETFRMRISEDPSAVTRSSTQLLRVDQVQDPVDADTTSLRKYQDFAEGFLDDYKVPLRLPYDPKAVQTYFNRRPHVVVFRLLEVATAFSGVAFQLLVEKVGLLLDKSRNIRNEDDEEAPRSSGSLKKALVGLGPTFIKENAGSHFAVAQSLSSRPDVIGTKNAKVLSELQDRLAPFPTEQATAIMEEELGVRVNQAFRELSPEPIAAASFGQVYRGWTVEGEEVAVKVQRPDLLFSVARDIYVLRLGLAMLRKLAKMNSDISVLADELGQGLFSELDYTMEAANSKEFGLLHQHLEFVKVPRILDHLTNSRVLTMEWINGDRPLDLKLIADGGDLLGLQFSTEQRLAAKQRLDSLVRKGVECSLVQLLETGFMHADPHPGNFLYTRESILAYLDFGLVVRVRENHRAAMLAVIAHLINGEWEYLADDFGDLELIKPSTDRFALRLALERAFGGDGPDAIVKNGKPDIRFGQLTGKLWKVALKFRFRLPAYYTLVLRSLVSLEGIAVSVDPNYKIFGAAYPYVIRRLLTDNSSSTRMVLRSLVLTNKDEVRWERISAIMTTSRKDVVEKLGILGRSSGEGSPRKHTSGKNVTSSLLGFALSNEGSPVRRILLTADTISLGMAFASPPAKPWRRSLASALGEAFFFKILSVLSKLSRASDGSDSTGGSHTEEIQSRENLSSGGSIELARSDSQSSPKPRTQRKRLRLLLRTLGGRLRNSPLVMLKVIWTVATILGFAVAVAVQRLAITLSTRLLNLTKRLSLGNIRRHRAGGMQAETDAVYNPV